MFAQLGNIKFEGLKTFQRFTESYSVILAQHARINTKAGLQMVGGNLDAKAIDVVLHNAFCNVDAEINALKTAMNNGEILPLILGTGEVLGDFVISDFSLDVLQATPAGKRLIVQVALNILEFFDTDPEASTQNAAASAGVAVQDGNIKPLDIDAPKPIGGAGAASASLTDAKVYTDDIPLSIDNSVTFADQATYWYHRISDGIDKAFEKLSEAENWIYDIQSEISNYAELAASIADTKAALTAFAAAMPPSSFSALSMANTNLQESVLDMRVASGVLNALTISRTL